MKQDDGGPAFPGQLGAFGRGNEVPVLVDHGVEYVALTTGMTLRDYFAGQALMGLLASPASFSVPEGRSLATHFAMNAYQYADAMLLERRKETDDAKA